jgi:hypothetical protein
MNKISIDLHPDDKGLNNILHQIGFRYDYQFSNRDSKHYWYNYFSTDIDKWIQYEIGADATTLFRLDISHGLGRWAQRLTYKLEIRYYGGVTDWLKGLPEQKTKGTHHLTTLFEGNGKDFLIELNLLFTQEMRHILLTELLD